MGGRPFLKRLPQYRVRQVSTRSQTGARGSAFDGSEGTEVLAATNLEVEAIGNCVRVSKVGEFHVTRAGRPNPSLPLLFHLLYTHLSSAR
jgi:hypothetical protein